MKKGLKRPYVYPRVRYSHQNNLSNQSSQQHNGSRSSGFISVLLILTLVLAGILVWVMYINANPAITIENGYDYNLIAPDTISKTYIAELSQKIGLGDMDPASSLGQMSSTEKTTLLMKQLGDSLSSTNDPLVTLKLNQSVFDGRDVAPEIPNLPVLGPIPTDGIKPLFGMKHLGGDAVFALACNYPKNFYQRFVGSLRKVGYEDDVVLAVSPVHKMKSGVEKYVKQMKVIAYAFDVDCIGKDNCKLKDDFLGYPDPRPHRTFANIRYALYEYWLQYYGLSSYILILDFRDTFFQAPPFLEFGPILSRTPATYDLRLYAENADVKTIGSCVFNSLWIGRCFGKPALAALKQYPVLCSGSTLGSYLGIKHYIRTMLRSMDTIKCWLKGIESDQGYQNYLFYNGYFNPPKSVTGMIIVGKGNVTAYRQGEGIVNTIGAMNGKRVPKDKKGPIDSFWKLRDSEGYVINRDGSRSACVHQWDRWYKELHKFIDSKLF